MAVITDNTLKYNSSQTEKDFLAEIVSYITSLDSRITCDTTADIQFSDPTNTPTFNFDIFGKYKFRLTRRYVLSTSDQYYYLSIVINGVEVNKMQSQIINNNRAERFINVIGENYFFLFYGNGAPNSITMNWSTGLVSTNTDSFAGGVSSTNILSAIFYDTQTNLTSYLPTLINFEAPIGELIYSELQPIATGTGTGILIDYIKDLYSCSTVPQFSSLGLDTGKNYYAVDSNIMVEI